MTAGYHPILVPHKSLHCHSWKSLEHHPCILELISGPRGPMPLYSQWEIPALPCTPDYVSVHVSAEPIRCWSSTCSEGTRWGCPRPELKAAKHNYLDPHRQSSASSALGSNCSLLSCWKSVTRHRQEEDATCAHYSPYSWPIPSCASTHHNSNKKFKRTKLLPSKRGNFFAVFYKKP